MQEEKVNYADFRLDRHDLVSEAEKSSSLYAYYSGEAADKRFERDKAKQRYDLRRGEKNLEYRNNPPLGKDGRPIKVTEDIIKALLDSDTELDALMQEYIELCRDTTTLECATKAISMKADMIRELGKHMLAASYITQESIAASVRGMEERLNEKFNKTTKE